MSHQERLEALKARHQALESAIAEENAHSHPDEVRINTLKKQKLRIKDEIAGLSAH
ncbi:MAG: YdcH family protein [Rhodospirillales bacterium]|nr:YdcH family protein [Rhodospirillales bacterium]